jgi:hypothetical protein
MSPQLNDLRFAIYAFPVKLGALASLRGGKTD